MHAWDLGRTQKAGYKLGVSHSGFHLFRRSAAYILLVDHDFLKTRFPLATGTGMIRLRNSTA